MKLKKLKYCFTHYKGSKTLWRNIHCITSSLGYIRSSLDWEGCTHIQIARFWTFISPVVWWGRWNRISFKREPSDEWGSSKLNKDPCPQECCGIIILSSIKEVEELKNEVGKRAERDKLLVEVNQKL